METIPTDDTTLLDKIRSVLHNGDTAEDIRDKLITKYETYFDKKIGQKRRMVPGDKEYLPGGTEDDFRRKAASQIRAEISSLMRSREQYIFDVDDSSRPHRYSFKGDVVEHEDIDDNKDDDIVTDITTLGKDIDIGYIYIIGTNLYDRDGRSVYKIGTTKDIDKRIAQLNSESGCYEKHVVKYVYIVERPYKVEHGIHCILDKGRVNPKKEGFYAHYVESHIGLIEAIIEIFVVEE